MMASEDGFTLVEVIVAMLLFTLVSTSIASLATFSLRQTVRNRHGTTAIMLAQAEMERLRGVDYDDIRPASATVEVERTSYFVNTDVLDDEPAPGMKQLNTTVTWTVHGITGSYDVDTIITAFDN